MATEQTLTDQAIEACQQGLSWSKERDYAGYDPYDGLNSPLLSSVATNWLTRLVAMHGVHKCPVNIRPLLGVPKERNPKGISLFATAYLNEYRRTGNEATLEEATELLEWLRTNQSPGYEEAAWGYNFDWQNAREFFLPAYEPSIVVTVFCGRAFLEYHEVTGDAWALDVARSAVRFIRNEINTEIVHGVEAYTYTPHDSFVLVNTNALAADFFYRVASSAGDGNLEARASELFDFVVETQTDDGGWYYSVPSSESHLGYDNFHTGFVLESLFEYATDSGSGSAAHRAFEEGLTFYCENLFDPDGAPRFESDQRYPYDAHAAAQAILTLTKTDVESGLRRDLVRWSLNNLFDDSGYFYRRIGRVLRDRTPYMRWSQAWMCRALSAFANSEVRSSSGSRVFPSAK